MVVGRNNGMVGLTGFSDKKMSGLLFGPQKGGRNNGVVVLTWWSYGGVPLYLYFLCYVVFFNLVVHLAKTEHAPAFRASSLLPLQCLTLVSELFSVFYAVFGQARTAHASAFLFLFPTSFAILRARLPHSTLSS